MVLVVISKVPKSMCLQYIIHCLPNIGSVLGHNTTFPAEREVLLLRLKQESDISSVVLDKRWYNDTV